MSVSGGKRRLGRTLPKSATPGRFAARAQCIKPPSVPTKKSQSEISRAVARKVRTSTKDLAGLVAERRHNCRQIGQCIPRTHQDELREGLA